MIDVLDKDVDSIHDVDSVTLWDDGYDASSPIKERLGIEVLDITIMDFGSDGIKDYNEMVCALYGISS